MDAQRTKSKLQEDLVSLYLRLNGFFVSGFIVHSPMHGQNRTEIDALALRLPFSAEPERAVGPDPLLDLSDDHTDLALCEVKGRGQLLRFNSALYAQPAACATILRWSGLFREAEVQELAQALCAALVPRDPPDSAAPLVYGPRGVRIRGLLFSPDRHSRRPNQPWFVTGPDIFRHVGECLCPLIPRASCATTYDLRLWGEHEPIVRYFKSQDAEASRNMGALYGFIERNAKDWRDSDSRN